VFDSRKLAVEIMSELEKRKVEHVKIVAQKDEMDRRKFYFDEIRLTHRTLTGD